MAKKLFLFLLGIVNIAYLIFYIANPQLILFDPVKSCNETSSFFPKDFYFDVPYRGFTYRGISSCHLDSYILGCGVWEEGILEALTDIFGNMREVSGGKPLRAIDIGAHRGTHTLIYSKWMDEVIAVEPNPSIYADLKHNLEANAISNVKALKVALGNSEGSAEFFLPPESNTGTGGLVKEFTSWHAKGVTLPSIQVPVVRADSLTQEASKLFHFAKIDVEGFEKSVLQGFQETLKVSRPVVLVEYTGGIKNGFSSLEELKQTFPSEYTFWQLKELSEKQTPKYSITPLGDEAAASPSTLSSYLRSLLRGPGLLQISILAVPLEKKSLLPKS